MPLCFLAAAAIGSGNVVKSGVNSSLARACNAPTVGALSSMLGGFLLSLLLGYCKRRPATGDDGVQPSLRNRLQRLKDCHAANLMGGVLGCLSLVSQTASVGPLGAVLMHSTQLATEICWAAALDHHGVLGTPIVLITRRRAIGLLWALLGVCLCAADTGSGEQVAGESGSAKGGIGLAFWMLVAVVAGATRTTQTVVNGSLGRCIQNKADAASWSLGSSTVILCVVAPLEAWLRAPTSPVESGLEAEAGVSTGSTGARALHGLEPWMLTGGLFSTCSVYGSVVLSSHISVAELYLGIMMGQSVMSAAVDYFGWLRLAQRGVGLQRTAGITSIVAGALLASATDNTPRLQPPAQGEDAKLAAISEEGVLIGKGCSDALQLEVAGEAPSGDQPLSASGEIEEAEGRATLAYAA